MCRSTVIHVSIEGDAQRIDGEAAACVWSIRTTHSAITPVKLQDQQSATVCM